MMGREKALTVVAALTLALGVGANALIFSLLYGVLLRPLPGREPARLVMIWSSNPKLQSSALGRIPDAPGDFFDWREQNTLFEQMAAFRARSFSLLGFDDPERIKAITVSYNFCDVMGIQPLKGRCFRAEEDHPGSERVTVVSYGMWKQRFGLNPDILGRNVSLDGRAYTIIGVMPPDFSFPSAAVMPGYFDFPLQPDLWTPLALPDQVLHNRAIFNLAVVGRLKPGVKLEQAYSELAAISQRIEAQTPGRHGWGVNLIPFRDQLIGDVRPPLLLLGASAVILLLIACVNIGNLLLSCYAARRRDIVIRTALGASRFEVMRQIMTGTILLALPGGLLGTVLAYLCTPFILALAPAQIPRMTRAGINTEMVFLGVLFTLGAGLLLGIGTAWYLSKTDFRDGMKEQTHGSTSPRRSRIRNTVVIAQVALALILMVSAGLTLRSLQRLLNVSPGFQSEHVLAFETELSSPAYADAKRQSAYYKTVLDRVQAIPAIKAAGIVSHLPLHGDTAIDSLLIEGRPVSEAEGELTVSMRMASGGYFSAMGIPLLAGRTFDDHDNEDVPLVVVINQSMARTFWHGEDAIGKRVMVGAEAKEHAFEGVWLSIIGITGDVRASLTIEPKPELYFSYLQLPWRHMAIVMKTEPEPVSVIGAVKNAIYSVDKGQPLYNVRPMREYVSDSTRQQRFSMLVLSILGLMAMFLSALGIYGVASHSVAKRTQEIGIRIALGSSRAGIALLVLKSLFINVGFGLVLGSIAAAILTKVFASVFWGIRAADMAGLLSVPLIILLAAVFASFAPAIHAARVDPAVALRTE
jgi:putative ABC transport system permease protein